MENSDRFKDKKKKKLIPRSDSKNANKLSQPESWSQGKAVHNTVK